MVPNHLRGLLCAGLLATAGAASALDRVTFEYGNSAGDAEIDRYGANATFDFGVQWLKTGDWYLGAYQEVGVNYWHSDPGRYDNDSLVDFSATPVLRWQKTPGQGLAPFLELGAGVHVTTESEIENKDFDINFTFGSHVGGGVRFGDKGRYELMYRFQHLSNASLGDKNPGVNFHLFNLGYHF